MIITSQPQDPLSGVPEDEEPLESDHEQPQSQEDSTTATDRDSVSDNQQADAVAEEEIDAEEN